MKACFITFTCCLILCVATAQPVFADFINTWVVWNNPVFNKSGSGGGYSFSYASQVTGTLLNVNNGTTVNVTYTGEAAQWSAFNGNGPFGVVNMWGKLGTYTNASVTTVSPYGNYITTTGYSGVTQTITFDKPVMNLLMSIGSLGDPFTLGSYNFNQPFVILSTGPGQWGSGTMTSSGNTLNGNEGDGVIQFSGSITSLSWTTPAPEAYSAFNVGITNAPVSGGAVATPEPGTMMLMGSGILGMLGFRRRELLAYLKR